MTDRSLLLMNEPMTESGGVQRLSQRTWLKQGIGDELIERVPQLLTEA